MILNKYFIEGNITPEFISREVSKHQDKTGCGAHSIFLGQVRDDEQNGKKVTKIIYTAYQEMAEKEISKIRELILSKYDLKCLHVFHSVGEINVGEISFFVFGSASHRNEIFEAVKEAVDLIKKDVPVWKKEVYLN